MSISKLLCTLCSFCKLFGGKEMDDEGGGKSFAKTDQVKKMES